MHPQRLTRVLIVANQTADSPTLMAAVAQRARESRCVFTLLVPASSHGLHRVTDPEDHGRPEAEARLSAAIAPLSEAVGHPVVGVLGSHDPLAAVQDAVNLLGFDEVIVSTLAPRISRWLRLDLAAKIAALGLPVTVVTKADAPAAPVPAA